MDAAPKRILGWLCAQKLVEGLDEEANRRLRPGEALG